MYIFGLALFYAGLTVLYLRSSESWRKLGGHVSSAMYGSEDAATWIRYSKSSAFAAINKYWENVRALFSLTVNFPGAHIKQHGDDTGL